MALTSAGRRHRKKKLKADGHFQLPAKKTDPVVLLASPEAPTSGLLERFRAARHLKDQIAALDQIVKALPDFTDASELQVLVTQIEAAAAKVRRLQPAHALAVQLQPVRYLRGHCMTTGPSHWWEKNHLVRVVCSRSSACQAVVK